ncbi:TetR/AcrR family transcriptional regulator [Streptomyces sp. NRRL F-5126]|uniref:TetR/AcrR family transcriptional regulator n=1 Tax=Streptomyces sp. NRRL F-5126 TaxID=1463857 RepID=UPI000691820E|nr:TetR/AcrR family transcriptional regulator [Streptomyces sp. NRRL F-5126]
MPGNHGAEPARGRPRDSGRDLAILDATLRLLVEVGYDQLSIESVAAEAGVGKPTIYRRHAGKAALVAAAVEHRAGSTPPAVPAGDLRQALLATAGWLAEQIAEQELGLLGALFAGMRGDPDLAAEMRRILRRDEAAMTEQPFGGVQDEHLVPGAAGLFAEIVPALIVHRLVFVGEPCDQGFVEHIVDDIVLPLIRRRGTQHNGGDTA